jgi:endonuclease/exonuclease/phosphatase family metal-dependent hydrolase
MRRSLPLRAAVLLSALLVATIFGGCASVGRQSAEAAPLRVLVYNIHAGKDAAGVDNLARVAALVRETDADLVLLQEVDRGTQRSGQVDQIEVLTRATGYHGVFGKTLDYQGGEYGIALLSRWPIREDTLIHLPVQPAQQRAGGSYEPRGMLHAVIAAPTGEIHALNTHLDASGTDEYRLQEATSVAAKAEALRATGRLVLVGGDLNATPASAPIRILTAEPWQDAWAQCGTGTGMTFPASGPIKRIDYLLLPSPFRCSSATVLESDASDHRPVLFTVETSSPIGASRRNP